MRIEAVQGDITTERVDAIVNAANSSLMGGGGVDGAIHRAAGPQLLAECRQVRTRPELRAGLPVGRAVATGAGDLAARWVVHTVGPNRHRGQIDPALLASCFTESLRVAAELDASSVAFPAIGAGIYGWDAAEVARIAVGALQSDPVGIERIRFVLFSSDVLAAFQNVLSGSRE